MTAGNAELLATKQDIISAAVQRELKERSFMNNLVMDVSNFAGKGMKSISYPRLTGFTVEERATATAGTIQDLTSSVDTLPLDKRAYISWLVDSNDDIQSTIDYQAEAAVRAASAHARFVDDAVIGELLTVSSLSVNGATAADITRDMVLEMRRRLMENEANMNNVALVINPAQEEAMLKIAEFSRADVYGQAVIPNGLIGRVYGIPVFIHNSPVLDDAGNGFQQAIMFDREACAIGFQRRPAFDEQKKIEFGTGAMLQAVDQLFGVKGMQLGIDTNKHTIGATVSPLAVKLAD